MTDEQLYEAFEEALIFSAMFSATACTILKKLLAWLL